MHHPKDRITHTSAFVTPLTYKGCLTFVKMAVLAKKAIEFLCFKYKNYSLNYSSVKKNPIYYNHITSFTSRKKPQLFWGNRLRICLSIIQCYVIALCAHITQLKHITMKTEPCQIDHKHKPNHMAKMEP